MIAGRISFSGLPIPDCIYSTYLYCDHNLFQNHKIIPSLFGDCLYSAIFKNVDGVNPLASRLTYSTPLANTL